MRRVPAATTQWPLALLLFALAFVLFQYAWPQLLPHPIHPDDYNNISGGFADISMRWKRFVSPNLIFAVAEFGIPVAYGALAALAVVDAVLVLLLVARVFGQRLGIAGMLAFAIVVSSHVSAFFHGTYLGLLTNLISHFFGLLALWALLKGWEGPRATWLVAGLAAYALSVFAKEDFLLPPLLMVAFLMLRAPAPGAVRRVAAIHWVTLAALCLVAIGAVWWYARVRNPFVAGLLSPDTAASTYAVDLTARGLALASWKLLGGYVPLASALALLAAGWLWWRHPARRLTVAWHLLTVAALVLPYALIPLNMPVFRAYSWLPWLVALVVVALQSVLEGTQGPAGRWIRGVAWTGLCLLAVVVHAPAHRARVQEYASKSSMNRAMVQAVLDRRDAIAASDRVGLVGLGESSPWCAQDAHYMRKLGFGTHWVVFVPSPTRCYTQQEADAWRRTGILVSVRPLEELCKHGDMPVLHFAPDGTATMAPAAAACAGPGGG